MYLFCTPVPKTISHAPPNYSNNPIRMHTGLFSSSVTLHRFQPTSQFPPKNTYHMHTGLFLFICYYCLRDIPKKFVRASISTD